MARAARALADSVIFSTENGLVWAHLPDSVAPVALGSVDAVTYMMRDFLAQCDLGVRLDRPRQSQSPAAPHGV